ncbi:MAG: hypothetical protein R3F56_26210 [Planctomycetota bacterium]
MRRALLVLLAACAAAPPPVAPARGAAAATVLFFVTTDCPIANAYAPEIAAIAAEHAGDPLRFRLVHVDPDLTLDQARQHAAEYGLERLELILDGDHTLVAVSGISVTPEVAVWTGGEPGSPTARLAYRGRIDDSFPDLGDRRPEPAHRELRDALAAILTGGQVAVERTQAVGCDMPSR